MRSSLQQASKGVRLRIQSRAAVVLQCSLAAGQTAEGAVLTYMSTSSLLGSTHVVGAAAGVFTILTGWISRILVLLRFQAPAARFGIGVYLQGTLAILSANVHVRPKTLLCLFYRSPWPGCSERRHQHAESIFAGFASEHAAGIFSDSSGTESSCVCCSRPPPLHVWFLHRHASLLSIL